MDEIVTTRIEKQLLDQIDKLVISGKYPNRSEAIRNILSLGISNIIKDELIGDLINEIVDDSNVSDEDLFEISEKLFDKPISQILAEERER